MCPLWPLHVFLLYLMVLFPLWLLCSGLVVVAAETWAGKFYPSSVEKLVEGNTTEVLFDAQKLPFDLHYIQVISADNQIAKASLRNGSSEIYLNSAAIASDLPNNLTLLLTGKFLGHTTVRVRATDKSKTHMVESNALPISVIRPERVIDTIFIASVAVLLSLNYINMGCSLDMTVVKETLRRPVGPVVGLLSQYIFMPLVSFGLAHVIFDSPNMRLGLFTLGCSPGGGASNMWTFLLGGNLNLSITMTFISNIVAFATMPAWLFSLGRIIFQSSNITIPYANIVTSLVALVFPVGIGLLIQRYLPRVAAVCRKILGPCSLFMILFIIIFGIYTNLYMFSLFDWRVLVGGMFVPWLGYAFGALVARIARLPRPDIVAVAVETGIQNTGIAIVLLKFSLPQPDGDLTSVVPVAAAIMMPVPLMLVMACIRIKRCIEARSGKASYTVCEEGANKPKLQQDSDSNPSSKENSDDALIKIKDRF